MPLRIPKTLEAQQARFLKYVDKISSPKGCWLWIGAKNCDGYGVMSMTMEDGHVEHYAHRIAYIWKYGFIPEGMQILHKRFCIDPACVNTDHTYVGTAGDNMADTIATTGNGQASLMPRQIRVIRLLYRRGWTQAMIARKFGLFDSHVSIILARKLWKHVI